ncbi:uncharacterized protein VICG_01044 [Vittaforma corneae ATCC 50505]|uniref:Proteasome alpha-type subunits domain-containing protein n=1 Tax=Vittaforma corneae (strain ATCC 50505) TaxID=993615 RepID=L2GMX9_VITCO|nr:uncharacterized protein VICG_01044 [Vittaforma corneae ATCC 50505]ELA41860.1 hypothetical protein VICG_01044 [Vittaforma corneae ATCC 50505]
MPELDFGNIYSSNGKIIQHRYAQKAIDAGSTMIAMKNSKGAVLLVSKPIVSRLHAIDNDHRIKRIAANAYMSYTGLLTDGALICSICKDAVRDYVSSFNSDITTEYLKSIIFEYVYMFTSSIGSRVIGASLFTIVKDEDEYSLLFTDCTGKVSRWNACAAGKGERRAFTELEKLSLEDMSIREMVDQGIKILHKCHDSLTEPKFSVEAGYIGIESNGEFARIPESEISQICEKYQDLSIDDEY